MNEYDENNNNYYNDYFYLLCAMGLRITEL